MGVQIKNEDEARLAFYWLVKCRNSLSYARGAGRPYEMKSDLVWKLYIAQLIGWIETYEKALSDYERSK